MKKQVAVLLVVGEFILKGLLLIQNKSTVPIVER